MTANETTEAMVERICRAAKAAAPPLARSGTAARNDALRAMARGVRGRAEFLKAENAVDVAAGEANGLSGAMVDRLRLTDDAPRQLLIELGGIERLSSRPNGLLVGRMRIPLGVIAIIYESRPNVTADAAALCVKSGNVVILRGGSEAIRSNVAIAGILRGALAGAGLPEDAVSLVPRTDRAAIDVLLTKEEYIDLVIPRGGEGLIRSVAEKSRIPVIKHYKGVCHVYVDEGAEIPLAVRVCVNAKAQRPGVCNAMETLLVHEGIASAFLPEAAKALSAAGVAIRGCPETVRLVPSAAPAIASDWGTEYLDLILAVRVVPSMDAAMEHIREHGSLHTEAIITRDHGRAMRFLREVDSSLVLVNASTRFNDGYQLGLGAEIGISTTKIHAFGPMGLSELTTTKFVAFGDGQVRQ